MKILAKENHIGGAHARTVHLKVAVQLRVVKALPVFFREIFSQNLLANQNRGIVCIIIPNFHHC